MLNVKKINGATRRNFQLSVNVMKYLFTISFCGCFLFTKAQKIDSIFFNLYTDSLKKGSWNYINVDAKLSNGKYMPLTSQQLIIKTSEGKLEGNSIWLDWDCKQPFITVEIQLKENPSVTRTKTIWVKKQDLQLNAPVQDSLLNQLNNRNKKSSSGKRRKN
ncbi:MAG TPA: hypothetical protein VFV46_10920 [Lacibacter sp.]|nr:hypothetical protein [Lacibacter sp.]